MKVVVLGEREREREREREFWWAKIMGLKLYFEIWNLLWVLGGKPVRFYFN